MWCTECQTKRSSCDLSLSSLLQLFVMDSLLEGCAVTPASVVKLAEFRAKLWNLQRCLAEVTPRLPAAAADLADRTRSNIERLLSLCVERAGPEMVDPEPVLSRVASE